MRSITSKKPKADTGSIGIFNRSYYEETLVVRVPPEPFEKETLPPELVTKDN
jgi:polyphosphate kinase 2 (PPK2 family)